MKHEYPAWKAGPDGVPRLFQREEDVPSGYTDPPTLGEDGKPVGRANAALRLERSTPEGKGEKGAKGSKAPARTGTRTKHADQDSDADGVADRNETPRTQGAADEHDGPPADLVFVDAEEAIKHIRAHGGEIDDDADEAAIVAALEKL